MNGWCYVSIFIVLLLLLLHCVGDEHLDPHWMSKLRKHFCVSALLMSGLLTFDSPLASACHAQGGWLDLSTYFFIETMSQ